VGTTLIYEASTVKESDPAEFEKIKRGETAVHTAYRKVKGLTRAPKEHRAAAIRRMASDGMTSNQMASSIWRYKFFSPSVNATCQVLAPNCLHVTSAGARTTPSQNQS
jgi:hypothetical protein